MYYVKLDLFNFSSVTMVLAVDAGHQMKKEGLFICSNHYWWRDICRVTGLGMENHY
jgi:hypothetical protein